MATGRNLLSVLTIISLAIGMFCTVILIFQQTKVVEKLEYQEWYRVGAAIANVFVVFFLSYLILTSGNRSVAYKIFLVVLLGIGVVAELVLTNIFTKLDVQYPVYLVITFNFLLRLYAIVKLVQEPWDVMTLTSASGAIPEAAPSVQTIVQKTTAPAVVERAMDEDARKFRDSFKEIVNQARTKVGRDNFDEAGKNRAYPEVIDPAVAARDFSKDRLKDAAKYLKDKSGNVIDLVFGGKRRR